jgi:superfamily II DNA/RNA helicase
MKSFSDFGLKSSLLTTLKETKISKPTEIQSQTIPMLMGGQSVVGVSETGSGKTLAYALPLLHQLKSLEEEGQSVYLEASPRAIIMVPTRELGEQVAKVFKTFTHHTRLRVRAALGGMALEQARRNIASPFEILLATPGRLTQLLEMELINLKDVRTLIFDEADQMLDQGFLPDSNRVVNECPEDIQMALFSATISPAVQDMINDLFASAEVVRSKGSGKVVPTLTTKNLIVDNGQRWLLLEKLLAQKIEGGTMIFTNTREQCDKLAKELTDKGYTCGIYRGDMDKNERRTNLMKFRKGQIDLLVSTDLAGRGLDLDLVGRVINFHLPKQMENYLHRAGRTARAGRKGLVVNLVTERDQNLITRLTGTKPQFKPRPAKEQANKEQHSKAMRSPAKTTVQKSSKTLNEKAPSLNAKPTKKSGSKETHSKKQASRTQSSESKIQSKSEKRNDFKERSPHWQKSSRR